MKRMSQPAIASWEGLVPSRPMPPVVYGLSSGTQALPSSGLMMGVGVDQVVVVVAGDGQDRLAVHLGVIQAIEEVDAARAAGSQAATQPAGVLGIAAGHERRRFLVPHLQEANPVLARPQRFHD